MAGDIWDWSTTPLTNQNSDAQVNWLEGTQLPSTVNDSSRQMMARVAELLMDMSAVAETAGTANAQTVTLASSFTTTGNYKFATFVATLAVTGTATLAANGLVAKAWKKHTAAGFSELETGDVVAGMRCICIYSSMGPGVWLLLNPATSAINAAAITALLASGDFTEAVQDVVGAFVSSAGDAGDITWTYNDAGNWLQADVEPNAITFAKMQDITTDRLLGRGTPGTGNPEELTVSGGIEFSGAGGIRTSAFTGDVTKAAGGTVTTIANDAVTLAKIQNIATDRLLGRDTAASGDTEELTIGGGLEFTGTGGVQTSAHTGDVTKAAGGTVTTIANDSVTNAKLADMAAATLKGSVAGGDPADLPATDATALLNIFTDVLKGLVPLSGGGAANFLRADGVWTAPSGAGAPLTDGDKGDITVTDTGATWTIDPNVVTYAKLQDISATDRLLGRDTAAAGDAEELTVGGGIEFTGTGGIQSSAHTGDVTKAAGGTVTTIPNDTVTYAKLQNVPNKRLLGRDTAATGDVEEVSTQQIFDWIGSPAQGDIHYRNAANWGILSAGGAGEVLQTGGAGANPSWSKRHSKLNVNLTQVGNVGTGEDDLITYSLPANTFAVNGDGVRITAWGRIAANANAKTLKMYWGTVVIFTNAFPTPAGFDWRIEAIVFRRASNIQEASAAIQYASVSSPEYFGAMTETDTAAITIKCTGTGTANDDIIQFGLLVESL